MDSRTAQILSALRTPKTYQELADKFGAGYYTVREQVQTLVDMGFVEEMPWRRNGTKQKQFRATVSNPDKQFTPEGVAVLEFFSDTLTPIGVINQFHDQGSMELLRNIISLPLLALSAPMVEYREAIMQGGVPGSSPTSDQVLEKLAVVHDRLLRLLSLVEQLMALGVWDHKHPENNTILFHDKPEKFNWEKITTSYSHLTGMSKDW